jgi:hypothetical protein
LVERRNKWSFFIRADGSWVWRVLHPDLTEACSERSFATVEDCMLDAEQFGYKRWPPENERRRSTQR